MKIFDSLKNKEWIGRGFNLKDNSLIILKSAKLTHIVTLKPGKYLFKIMGKKRTGSGKVLLEILGESDEIIIKREVNFSNSSWSEFNFEFEIPKLMKNSKIRFSRSKNIYGSIEIGRLYLNLSMEIKVENLNSRLSRRKINDEKYKDPYLDMMFSFNERKKIIFIVPYHIYGGAEVYIQNIINQIANKHTITIIYMNQNSLQNYIVDNSVNHRVVKNFEQFRGLIKSLNYDYIIFYNRSEIYHNLIEMKKANEIESNLIEIYHSDFIWPGSLSILKTRECLNKIIVVSESLGLNINGISETIREVIPVGINLKKFEQVKNENIKAQLDLEHYKGIIGTVARLSKEKNIDYILDLAKEMSDYGFIIVGDGPEEKRLRDIIKDKKLKNISLIGFQKEVEIYYQIFDAFVLASKIEGTPISILEAMASKVPVFSNMVGAIPDIVQDKKTGFRLTQDIKKDIKIIQNNIGNIDVINCAFQYVNEKHNIEINSQNFIRALISNRNFFVEKTNNDVILLPGQYI